MRFQRVAAKQKYTFEVGPILIQEWAWLYVLYILKKNENCAKYILRVAAAYRCILWLANCFGLGTTINYLNLLYVLKCLKITITLIIIHFCANEILYKSKLPYFWKKWSERKKMQEKVEVLFPLLFSSISKEPRKRKEMNGTINFFFEENIIKGVYFLIGNWSFLLYLIWLSNKYCIQ